MEVTPRELFEYAAGQASVESQRLTIHALSTGGMSLLERGQPIEVGYQDELLVPLAMCSANDIANDDSDVSHANCSPVRPPMRSRSRRAKLLRRGVVAAALAIAAVGTAGRAAWEWLIAPPLFYDDFNDEVLHSVKWLCRRPVVREEGGYLRLLDRGFVMLGGEYSTGYELEFDWRPIDLAGHAHYLDILTIALRSSGMPRSQHSYEAEEGILVKLDSQGGKVTMSRASGGEEIEALATTSIMEVPIRADEWHHVRIRDDGVTIAVYVRGPAIDASEPEAPVLIADVDGSGIGSRVAIYNREHLADVPHESHIDNVTIRTIVAR